MLIDLSKIERFYPFLCAALFAIIPAETFFESFSLGQIKVEDQYQFVFENHPEKEAH
ncbi:hypothetical protein [Paenibacillus algorifonticola]|uniref:hypothetical protein n=1 Tax=Paenibacillus algorifonticola TaxID=684063 RepID=UPI0012E12A27|nr:hypothetical protein [Paenibacillus algorifonticola]